MTDIAARDAEIPWCGPGWQDVPCEPACPSCGALLVERRKPDWVVDTPNIERRLGWCWGCSNGWVVAVTLVPLPPAERERLGGFPRVERG